MKPIQKVFSDTSLFQFDLVYMDTKNPESELPDHLHDRFELVYVYGGKGTFFIDQTFYEMRAGDLFVIPGNTIHRAFPDPDEPVTSTAIFFTPALAQHLSLGDSYSSLWFFDMAKRHDRYKIETLAHVRIEIEKLVDEMQQELQQCQFGYHEAILIHLLHLLLMMNRLAASNSEIGRDVGLRIGPPWMMDTLHYIDRHPDAELALSGLSRRAAVTPSHFSRVFRQMTGLNVSDYVNMKRISFAKELLQVSDANIEAIASQCGYESLPHFHRTFKKLTGMTPAAYKRENSKNNSLR